MSLAFATRPLQRRTHTAVLTCHVCASIGSTARVQWQATRLLHFIRSSPYHGSTAPEAAGGHRVIRLSHRRSASTTPLKAGPTVNFPEFPSHNRPAPAPPSKLQVLGAAPSFDALRRHEDWGEDTELVDPEEAKIYVTEPALKQLVKIASREPAWNPDKPHVALRLAVESGGCHGYQYDMKLVEQEPNVDDYVFKVSGSEGQSAVPIVIDLISLGLLKGSTLHFATELIGSAFGIKDNPQAKESGSCGCGISWEAK